MKHDYSGDNVRQHRQRRNWVIREALCALAFVVGVALAIAALWLEPLIVGVTP